MKKLFAILAIAGALTACNNSGDSAEGTDTTGSTMDTSTVAPLSTDTSAMSMDTTTGGGLSTDTSAASGAGAGADTTTR